MTDITGDEIRRMFREHEQSMARLVNQIVGPIKEDLHEIKVEVKKTNGRVSYLELDRATRMAREGALAEAAANAAHVVAEKAADAIAARERSTKWKFGMASLALGSVGLVTTFSAFLASHLHS